MSITFDYQSVEPVPVQVAVHITADARGLQQSIDWWAEPISVRQDQRSQRLVGSTRIHLGGYGLVDVPPEEEALMVCRDTKIIVRKLVEWSQKYKITWQLSEAGQVIGVIDPEGHSGLAKRYVDGTCQSVKLPMSKVDEVLKKHGARKD